MSDEETIHVADVSDGRGGAGVEPGTPVEVPVVEILTGRGFITGKSGSGKSNTASVFIESLLDNNFPVLIVDSDGEYYGLKEEYEILHAGADEECDIVVSPEHAEKIASLALEQNVPIILDVSGYLEEDTANELLLEVVKHLFAKEKKLKKPFLLVLEECHEYIPEGGGMDETGKMLIKVGKRGRKHGLGIVGISQRPADVKKDFITQCDWLTWHRLTWDNDTKVVSRILGSTYADEIEDMDDGEAFMMTDWDESIRRIQFHRKQTFDAGATPGLDDFERPELKSVSGDLVSELETIADEKERHESEMADLRQELDKKRQRINQLERELEDARDMSNMADKFAQALLQKAEAPYRGGDASNGAAPGGRDQSALDDYDAEAEASADAADDTAPADAAEGREAADGGKAAAGAADAADAGAPEPDAEEPPTDVDPVSRDAVAEGALRFDAAMEHGTREAVIEELRERIAGLPELSVAMLRHYRREGESEPLAAHIDAGGNGDAEHAYARHRPIRRSGLIRHAGRGSYEYAVPALIREAYADRLSEDEVAAMVAEVEEAFVPPGERRDAPEADIGTPSAVEDAPRAGAADASDAADAAGGSEHEGAGSEGTDEAPESEDGPRPTSGDEAEGSRSGLSDAAKRFARTRSDGRAADDGGSEAGATDDGNEPDAANDEPDAVDDEDVEILDS
ncbi:helicase HerA domain-containing protein [Haloparvum alkalitolerans]|uniref:ATP-binding protein n=1 Tax=Haloparvum alkalitolerans TaxID=1042953 RepID=UPI003CEB232A